MEQYKVYRLLNSTNSIEYIGQTGQSLDARLRGHLKALFKDRVDIKIELVDSFKTRKEALTFEGAYKISNNFEWTERTKNGTFEGRSKGGKKTIITNCINNTKAKQNGGIATTSLRYTCPYCGNQYNPGALGSHIKYKHKNAEGI